MAPFEEVEAVVDADGPQLVGRGLAHALDELQGVLVLRHLLGIQRVDVAGEEGVHRGHGPIARIDDGIDYPVAGIGNGIHGGRGRAGRFGIDAAGRVAHILPGVAGNVAGGGRRAGNTGGCAGRTGGCAGHALPDVSRNLTCGGHTGSGGPGCTGGGPGDARLRGGGDVGRGPAAGRHGSGARRHRLLGVVQLGLLIILAHASQPESGEQRNSAADDQQYGEHERQRQAANRRIGHQQEAQDDAEEAQHTDAPTAATEELHDLAEADHDADDAQRPPKGGRHQKGADDRVADDEQAGDDAEGGGDDLPAPLLAIPHQRDQGGHAGDQPVDAQDDDD